MLIKFNERQQIAIIASFARFTKTHPSLRRWVEFSGFSQPIGFLLYFWHPMWREPSREYFPWKANNHLLVEYPLTQPDSLVSSKMIIIVWLMESQINPFFFIMIVKLLQVEQFVTLSWSDKRNKSYISSNPTNSKMKDTHNNEKKYILLNK